MRPENLKPQRDDEMGFESISSTMGRTVARMLAQRFQHQYPQLLGCNPLSSFLSFRLVSFARLLYPHSMGFAYANEQVIQYMNNVKAPYNVNRLSQEVAVRALSDLSLYKERVAAMLEVRPGYYVQWGWENRS